MGSLRGSASTQDGALRSAKVVKWWSSGSLARVRGGADRDVGRRHAGRPTPRFFFFFFCCGAAGAVVVTPTWRTSRRPAERRRMQTSATPGGDDCGWGPLPCACNNVVAGRAAAAALGVVEVWTGRVQAMGVMAAPNWSVEMRMWLAGLCGGAHGGAEPWTGWRNAAISRGAETWRWRDRPAGQRSRCAGRMSSKPVVRWSKLPRGTAESARRRPRQQTEEPPPAATGERREHPRGGAAS